MINLRGKGTLTGLCTGIFLLLMAALCTGGYNSRSHTVIIVDTVVQSDTTTRDTVKKVRKSKKSKKSTSQPAPPRQRSYLDEPVSHRSNDAAHDDTN